MMVISRWVHHIGEQHALVIGSKSDTEGEILSEIMAQMIEAHSSIHVVRKYHLDNTFICFQALLNGDIDLYTEYTGTALTCILKQPPITNSQEAWKYLEEEFKQKYELIWLFPFGFSNCYVLIVKPEKALELHLDTLSDLSLFFEKGGELNAAFDPEFI